MKGLHMLLAVLILSLYCCQEKEEYCDTDIKANGIDDCKNLKLDEEEMYKCCFAEGKGNGQTEKNCWPVTKGEYDEIKDFIKTLESEAKKDAGFDVEYSVDCSSNYIIISLLSLILLFL